MKIYSDFTCLMADRTDQEDTFNIKRFEIKKQRFQTNPEYQSQQIKKHQKLEMTEKAQEYRTENKYDPYLIRDTVNTYIENVLEKQEKRVVEFSNKFLDTKVVLGFLILIVILASHFYPLPFPQNIYVLIACIAVYFALSTYYSHYENQVEGETFALFSIEEKKEGSTQKESGKKQLYRFNSNIEMLSDTLELSISLYEKKDDYLAKQEIKIQEYFDVDGYLCVNKLSKLLEKMLSSIKLKSQ